MPHMISAPFVWRTCLFSIFVCLMVTVSEAQVYTVKPGVRGLGAKSRAQSGKTILQIELIAGRDGGLGLSAQQWQQSFAKLGVAVRIRNATSGEKLLIREVQRGPLRRVTVIGQLERNGTLTFKGRTFRRSEAKQLGEWIRELQTYGAQGAPTGKPLWGLNKSQFSAVFNALKEAIDGEVTSIPLDKSLTVMKLPTRYPLRMSAAAEAHLKRTFPELPAVRQQVKGMSKGTSLAAVLIEYGLGFRPLRTPKGSIELVVEPLGDPKDRWPVGWPAQGSLPKTAPKLYELLPISLDEQKFQDVVDVIAVKTGIPVLIDRHRIAGKGMDLDKLRVSYGPKRASWSLLLRGITVPYRLAREVRIDERGAPFVWITVSMPKRLPSR
jgi:hypothetical protein